MSEQPPGSDLDGGHEFDLRSIWRRITDRWWLPVAGLVIGAVVGVLVTAGGGQVFAAKALVYVGQPFGPGGGRIHTLGTYTEIISQIASSEAVIEKTAATAGLTPRQLRGRVKIRAITPSGNVADNLSPLVEITVLVPTAAKAKLAAAALADIVIRQSSVFTDRKIALLKGQLEQNDTAIAAARARLQEAIDSRKRVIEDKQLSLADRLLIQANANSAIQFYEARLTNRQADRTTALELLSFATEVERSRLATPATAVRTSAASPRNSGVIGGVIGLLVGVFAAYLADPLLRLRNGSTQAA